MPTILIPTLAERNKIGVDAAYPLNGDYLQTANIDATAGLTVIGTGTGVLRFAGIYNGGGFATTNCTVNTPLVDTIGFFGSMVGATISNIADITGSFTGNNSVGPLIGRCYTSAVSNCKCSAAASGANFAGGLVGYSQTSATITNCIATGAATATTNYAGGLVGTNTISATIINCYATGVATSPINAGGLVGTQQSTGGLISGCFCTGVPAGGTNRRGAFIGEDQVGTGNIGALTVAEGKNSVWYRSAGWDYAATWVQPVVMPTITGLDLDSAGAALCAVGCTVGTITQTYHATIPAGQIITQSIPAGGTADYPQLQAFGIPASPKTGDVVNVTVSLGNQVEVPNTLGLTQALAVAAIEEVGLVAGVETANSAVVEVGDVIGQRPAAGGLLAAGGTVTVTVSLGALVPDVDGLHYRGAEALIEAAGLVYAQSEAYSADVVFGYAVGQSPAAGGNAALGATVTVTVSKGPEMVAGLRRDLRTFGQALAEEAAFQAWCGAVDSEAAAEFIYYLTADRDLKEQAIGFKGCVIAPASGTKRRAVDLENHFVTEPEFTVEFVHLVDPDDADSEVFDALMQAVDTIMLALYTQETSLVDEWGYADQDNPTRAGYGTNVVDWCSLTAVVKGNDWQGEI